MKRFAALYRELDASTAIRDKQAALQKNPCERALGRNKAGPHGR